MHKFYENLQNTYNYTMKLYNKLIDDAKVLQDNNMFLSFIDVNTV